VDGVRFMLPDWLPMEAPDHPSYSVRPIFRRYLDWGRPALAGLNAVASAVWVPPEEASGELVFADGSTVPPAWYLQRDEDESVSLQAVGLGLDDLRTWLEREVDPVTAKAVLWHYPAGHQTAQHAYGASGARPSLNVVCDRPRVMLRRPASATTTSSG
jgi:hypothetical protein